MGRLLGAYADDADLDRPDLNKCPDCGCYFAQMDCPLCGKICPEEYRAGNRKAVKKKKKRSTGSGRSYFVEWYHSWWFIALMLFFFPIVGIVLLFTSPHKISHKLIFAVVGVAVWLLSTFGIGILSGLIDSLDPPVDMSMSREEYVSVCEAVDSEAYYRSAAGYTDKFVTMTLTVESKIITNDSYYDTYYICKDPLGGDFRITVRNCVQENGQNFLPGDRITVYGEGAGEYTIYDMDYYNSYTYPCIHAAYMDLN